LEEELQTIEEEIAEIDQKGRRLSEEMAGLDRAIGQHTADLAEKRKESSELEQKLQAIQHDLENLHMALAQNETEIKTSRIHLRSSIRGISWRTKRGCMKYADHFRISARNLHR